MSWLPDCVICRRQVCEDHAECSRQLGELVERSRDRFEDEHLSGLRDVRLREVAR